MLRRIVLQACFAVLALNPAGAGAAEEKPPQAAMPAPPAAATQPGDAMTFCRNVANAAADARFALQTKKLTELEAEVAKRVAALDAKQSELKELLQRHDEAMRQAQASLVAIYAKMRPDAAALQIAALDDATAAALLQSLNARQSSAILNEIPTERAVKLVAAIQALTAPEGRKS